MKKLILIISIFFTCALAGAENRVPEYEPVEVNTDAIKGFFSDKERPGTGKDESDFASAKIEESLRISFNSAWKIFESRKDFITDPIIREAIEALRIKIKNNKKYISIRFMFDENYAKYYEEKFSVKGENGKTKGNLTYEQMIKNKDVGGTCWIIDDVSPKGARITIYNGFEDFQSMNMGYHDKAKGCIYEGVEYYSESVLVEGKKDPPEGWEWAPTNKTYSFQSVLFHELVHVALDDAGLNRKGDDATVEDITLQIFPRDPNNNDNAHGDNLYEMTYDKALVDGSFKLDSISSFLKRLAIELFPLIVKDEYYYNRIHSLNPGGRCSLPSCPSPGMASLAPLKQRRQLNCIVEVIL